MDELINHTRHSTDSATVTAQLRPHSFNHLTAHANAHWVRFHVRRLGNITTHMLVYLPRAKSGPAWHLSGFAFSLGSCTRAGILMDAVFLEAKLLIFPSIFPVHWPYEWDNGIQTRGSDGPSGIVDTPIMHSTSTIVCSDFLYSSYLFPFPNQHVVPPSTITGSILQRMLFVLSASVSFHPRGTTVHFNVRQPLGAVMCFVRMC